MTMERLPDELVKLRKTLLEGYATLAPIDPNHHSIPLNSSFCKILETEVYDHKFKRLLALTIHAQHTQSEDQNSKSLIQYLFHPSLVQFWRQLLNNSDTISRIQRLYDQAKKIHQDVMWHFIDARLSTELSKKQTQYSTLLEKLKAPTPALKRQLTNGTFQTPDQILNTIYNRIYKELLEKHDQLFSQKLHFYIQNELQLGKLSRLDSRLWRYSFSSNPRQDTLSACLNPKNIMAWYHTIKMIKTNQNTHPNDTTWHQARQLAQEKWQQLLNTKHYLAPYHLHMKDELFAEYLHIPGTHHTKNPHPLSLILQLHAFKAANRQFSTSYLKALHRIKIQHPDLLIQILDAKKAYDRLSPEDKAQCTPPPFGRKSIDSNDDVIELIDIDNPTHQHRIVNWLIAQSQTTFKLASHTLYQAIQIGSYRALEVVVQHYLTLFSFFIDTLFNHFFDQRLSAQLPADQVDAVIHTLLEAIQQIRLETESTTHSAALLNLERQLVDRRSTKQATLLVHTAHTCLVHLLNLSRLAPNKHPGPGHVLRGMVLIELAKKLNQFGSDATLNSADFQAFSRPTTPVPAQSVGLFSRQVPSLKDWHQPLTLETSPFLLLFEASNTDHRTNTLASMAKEGMAQLKWVRDHEKKLKPALDSAGFPSPLMFPQNIKTVGELYESCRKGVIFAETQTRCHQLS